MAKIAEITYRDNRFLVSGDLNCFNVMSVYKRSLTHFDKSPVCEFDLSAVKSSDSAGLALMIEWVKRAKEQGKKVLFLNVSEHIMSLARAAGLAELIISK